MMFELKCSDQWHSRSCYHHPLFPETSDQGLFEILNAPLTTIKVPVEIHTLIFVEFHVKVRIFRTSHMRVSY